MITSAFIYFAGIALRALLTALLPFTSILALPSNAISSSLSTASTYLVTINTFIPLFTVGIVVSWIVALELVYMSFYIFRFLLNFIPGVKAK